MSFKTLGNSVPIRREMRFACSDEYCEFACGNCIPGLRRVEDVLGTGFDRFATGIPHALYDVLEGLKECGMQPAIGKTIIAKKLGNRWFTESAIRLVDAHSQIRSRPLLVSPIVVHRMFLGLFSHSFEGLSPRVVEATENAVRRRWGEET